VTVGGAAAELFGGCDDGIDAVDVTVTFEDIVHPASTIEVNSTRGGRMGKQHDTPL